MVRDICRDIVFPELWSQIEPVMSGGVIIAHNAGSDSRACAELLLNYMRHHLNVGHYVRQYDFVQICTRSF